MAQTLAPLVDRELLVPYPGTWARPPYESLGGRTVIAADPGLSSIVVEPVSGAVVLVDSSGESVVNRSVDAFVACARSYTAALNTADVGAGARNGSSDGGDDGHDDGDDDAWEAIGDQLIEEIRRIDPAAAVDEGFWSVAAEEVGYGMLAPSGTALPASDSAAAAPPAESAKTQLLLAMSDERRAELFTSGQWQRLTSATRVTVAPALPQLTRALDLMAQIAAQRGQPAQRPDVLLCADAGDELVEAIGAGLLDRLPGLRWICRLTPTTNSAAAGAIPVAKVPVPVFTFGDENGAEQVISIIASRAGGRR